MQNVNEAGYSKHCTALESRRAKISQAQREYWTNELESEVGQELAHHAEQESSLTVQVPNINTDIVRLAANLCSVPHRLLYFALFQLFSRLCSNRIPLPFLHEPGHIDQ